MGVVQVGGEAIQEASSETEGVDDTSGGEGKKLVEEPPLEPAEKEVGNYWDGADAHWDATILLDAREANVRRVSKSVSEKQ